MNIKSVFNRFFDDPVDNDETPETPKTNVTPQSQTVTMHEDVSVPKDTKANEMRQHSDREARMKHLREVVLENQYKNSEVLNQMFNADKTKILVVVKQSLDLDILRRHLNAAEYTTDERAIPGYNDWAERLRKLCGVKVTSRYVVNVTEVTRDEFGFRRLGKPLLNEVRREYPQDYLDLFDFPTIDDDRAK